MLLNYPARLALSFALLAVFAWLFLSLWRQERNQQALRLWGAGYAVMALSMLGFALRGVLPSSVVIAFANAALFLGYALIWAGARRFAGLGVPPAGLLAGAAAWLLACTIPAFVAMLPARVALASAIGAAYYAAAAHAFLLDMRRGRLHAHAGLIGLMLALALVFLLRGGAALVLPFDTAGTAAPESGWNALLTILITALTAGIGVMLVALARERSELESNAAMAAARDAAAAARDAAAAASAEKSRFLARMSHELRTPLNGVLGMAQVLAADPALPARHREQAEMLERAGRHLLAIVNDVLDLARVEAGRLELAPRPLELRAALEEVLDLVRPMADVKGIVLRAEFVPGLPAGVLADPVRLRQVLLNLLGNAVKFTPAGGQVGLRASVGEGGALRLAVADTGPGVPDAVRGRLFREFVQGDAAQEGTGLGLVISAALARAMGGGLDYAPGPGGTGSIFTATLPLPAAAPPEPSAATAVAAPAPGRWLRLLVVDDVRPNRLVIRALLMPEGHLVEEAEDGLAAIAALQTGPLPDLVLMDVQMPGMDGYEATRAIRALHGPAARVPVIALTGDALAEDIAAARAAGMDGHLTKPVERARLLAMLAEYAPRD